VSWCFVIFLRLSSLAKFMCLLKSTWLKYLCVPEYTCKALQRFCYWACDYE
jgi:hypothetical protein